MSSRDVVVLSGSAGGVEALIQVLSELPADLPAAVLVNLHLAMSGPSLLPQVLRRDTRLEVVAAQDGMPLRPGCVVVGVPDRHLLVVDGRIELGRGARENNHRPSHDAMLRSVALDAGHRAVGVVLTGLLDDGSAGLRTLSRYGGCCVVQDPATAQFADMPRHALAAVPEALSVPLERLAEELVRMVQNPAADPPEVPEQVRALDRAELDSARGLPNRMPDGSVPGEPSGLACPDCHGVLFRMPQDDGAARFRCRTGHAWTSESLLAEQDVALEQALWTALRSLEERAEVAERLASRARETGRLRTVEGYDRRSAESRAAARALRVLLDQTAPPPAEEQAAP